jgi:Bacterial regulatory proteins, tetR family.
MDAFWRNGFEATSAQELVESTGLGRGSLYGAFGNKENIYHEALRRYHSSSIEFHEAVFSQAGSVKDRLRILLEKGIEQDFSNIERNGCMAIFSPLERAAKDKTVEDLSRSYITKLETMFTKLFAAGIAAGEFQAERQPEVMARAFMCAYFGFRVFGRIVHKSEYQREAIEALMMNI